MASKKVVAAKAKKVANVRKPTRTKAKKSSTVAGANTIQTMINDPAKIFATFSTNVELHGGLSVIRPLGNGKYEIVSLNAITQNAVGSAEAAELVKSVPERQAALNIDKKQWEAAMLKCDIAVRVTKGDLFRFFALPPELRQTIYELVMFNPSGLKFNTRKSGPPRPFAGLGFMLTCREVYEETMPMFLQNTFHIHHKAALMLRGIRNDFAKNLVDIEFDWSGTYSDAKVFRDIAKYPNLRILRINFQMIAVTWRTYRLRVWNALYQDDEDLKWFSPQRGFDQILKIRGLEKVVFELEGCNVTQKLKAPVAQKKITELLNQELTKPRSLPVTKAVKGKKGARQVEVDNDDDDHDHDHEFEQEYVPRPTKSRRAKAVPVSYDDNADGFIIDEDE